MRPRNTKWLNRFEYFLDDHLDRAKSSDVNEARALTEYFVAAVRLGVPLDARALAYFVDCFSEKRAKSAEEPRIKLCYSFRQLRGFARTLNLKSDLR